MKPAQQFLRTLGIKMAADETSRQKLIQRLKTVGGHSIEKSIIIHSSLTIFSKELTVFLGYKNQELMSNLCDWYDCDPNWTYATIGRGDETITNVWVNLFGATTPELIQLSLPVAAVGGGLTSRIIFINEDAKGKLVLVPRKTNEEIAMEHDLLNDLGKIQLMSGEFSITDEWLVKWMDWYKYQDTHPPFRDKRLEGYLGRRGTHVMKLCMVMNASRIDGNMVMDSCDFDRALFALQNAERKMPQVFGGFGRMEYSDVLNDVMLTVTREKEIKFNELLALHYRDTDADILHKMVVTMEKIGFAKKNMATNVITYIKKEETNEEARNDNDNN